MVRSRLSNVRQGCNVAPDLVLNPMDWILDCTVLRRLGVNIGEETFTDLDNADDVALLAEMLETGGTPGRGCTSGTPGALVKNENSAHQGAKPEPVDAPSGSRERRGGERLCVPRFTDIIRCSSRFFNEM